MKKAFSYIRFSTPEQLKGDSLRRQLDDAHDWCDERGVELDDSLRDLGKSAYRGSHAKFGALRRFLDLVEDGTVPRGSFLIVESLDRLSREAVLDALPRLLDLIAAGITVVTLIDGQEYSDDRLRSDPTPLIVSLLIMMRAHEESRSKSVRVSKAWAQKRKRAEEDGQAMTSIAPAWIRLVGGSREGHYELIPERAEIVEKMFHQTVAGKGRRSIANALNEAKVETWGSGGKKGARWHDSYVQKIINNPAAIGWFEPLGKLAGGDGLGTGVIKNYFPAVVSEELFYAAQGASKTRRMGQGRSSNTHRNILRGLAKCHSCGSNLVIIDKGKRSSGPKLVCGSAHAGSGCAPRVYYPYGPLEAYVLAAISDRIDGLLLSSQDQNEFAKAELKGLVNVRNDTQKSLDNLLDIVESGNGGTSLSARIGALQREVDALTARIEVANREIKASEATSSIEIATQFRQVLEQLRHGVETDRSHHRATIANRLRQLVDKIVVSPTSAVVELASGEKAHVHGFLT